MAMDFTKIIGVKVDNKIIDQIAVLNGPVIWQYQLKQYRELEYIHFDGNSGIVGVHFPQNYSTTYIRYEYKVSWDTITGNNRAFAAYKGSNTSANRRAYIGGCMDSASNHYLRACIGGTWLTYNNVEIQTNTPYLVTFAWSTNRTMYLNVNNLGTINTQLTSNVSVNTYPSIGGTYDGDTNALTADSQYNLIGNIYYLKKTDSSHNALIDLVPAQRKSDGAVGLYDKIANVFYPKDCGTGTITAGPIVDENPSWAPNNTLSYTDSGGDGDRDWSNTYSSPGSTSDYPHTLTITNIPPYVKTIKLSCSYRCGYTDSSGQNAYNKVTCDGTVVKESSRAAGNLATLSGSISNKYITVGSSNKVLLQAILNYQSGTSNAHMLTLQYNASDHTITCTINKYAGSGGVYNRIWLSNINMTFYCI